MGTTWHVSYLPAASAPNETVLQQGIEEQLEQVNTSMSTYQADSEISLFNTAKPQVWFPVSADFFTVLSAALDVGKRSEGAYDVTVAPLVELWGFGAGASVDTPPTKQQIAQLKPQIGQGKLRLDSKRQAVKKTSLLSLDFSSLAKGFAVDQVAQWLLAQGIDRFMVEVGGEMRLSGLSGRGDPWRIAIEQPDSSARAVALTASLTGVAIATSGDYRNYFEADGERYSHSIDPRTGYPVAHDLVSVTVVDASAMMADAWATALVVLGAEQAMAVAQSQELAVYFIRRVDDDFVHSHTPLFSRYLGETQQ